MPKNLDELAEAPEPEPSPNAAQEAEDELDDSAEGKIDPAEYAKNLAKAILSHIGLGVAVTIYVVGGALLFQEIELPGEEDQIKINIDRSWELEGFRSQLADALWNHKWSQEYNKTVEQLLNEYHKNVTEAIQNNAYPGKGINTDDVSKGWAFASALLFTVSVVTTIGYGHVAPGTELGQLVLIAYALIGIPLMLMFLANIGDAMAKFFRVAYGRGCCYCCNRKRKTEYQTGHKDHMAKRQAERANSGGRNGSAQSRSAWDDPDKKPGSADLKSRKGKKNKVGDIDEQRRQDEFDQLDDDEYVYIPPEALEPPDDQINVPISLTLVVIAAYVMIGAVLFSAWNDWTWITGAYFSFVTLSTIGFGDLVPGWDNVGTTEGNIKLGVSSFYIIMGLAVLSMAFNLMMEEMIEKVKWLGKKIGIIDDEDEVVEAIAQKGIDPNGFDSKDTTQLMG